MPMFMMSPTLAAFASWDWVVLGGYFALLAGTGLWLSRRRQADAADYFLARHAIPPWAAAASLIATSLSAATFIGAPEQSYAGNLTYLSSYIGTLIAIVIVAWLFIPAFYRYNVTTVYGLLEHRFGPGARMSASMMFLVGRVLAEGSRLFMASIAASLIAFGDTQPHQMLAGIIILVIIGVFYTFIGGIRSVIFSDVIQLGLFLAAALVALGVLIWRIPADWSTVLETLRAPAADAPSKLILIDPGVTADGVEWSKSFTLITAVSGLVILNLAAYATDHDMAQRVLTCRSAAAGARSAIGGVLGMIPVAALFMLVGLGLWIFYQRADLMGDAAPRNLPAANKDVFVHFILNYLPTGVRGLLMVGLFAAAISTVNSALNSMSAVLVTEVYRPLRQGRDESHYLRAGRAAVVGWGVVVGTFACICVYWYTQWSDESSKRLINFALGVMTFAYSGLVAVFATAVFTSRGSDRSVMAALVVGFFAIVLLRWQPWIPQGHRIDLAFPWQMLIASALAFGVCCLDGGAKSAVEARDANDD